MIFSITVSSQIIEPVTLQFSSVKKNKNTYEIHVKANIQKGWHIFSQSTDTGGSLPTNISFKKNKMIIVNGNLKEVGVLKEKYEDVFEVNTKYYYNIVDFVQLVKTKTNAPVKLEGTIMYMACKDEQCLTPQEVEFEIMLN